MCLKIGEHLDIQITYKILWLGFPKPSSFGISRVISREAVFLTVFMKNKIDPLGVNTSGNRREAWGIGTKIGKEHASVRVLYQVWCQSPMLQVTISTSVTME